MAQLDNLEALGEQNRLLKEQNSLLEKANKALTAQLYEGTQPKPYKQKKKRTVPIKVGNETLIACLNDNQNSQGQ